MTNPEQTRLFDHRLTSVERAVETIASAVQEIAKNTTQIARIEVLHAETREGLERAFKEISLSRAACTKNEERLRTIEIDMPALREAKVEQGEIEKRVLVIETAMPGLKETRSWVLRAMLALCGVVGVAVMATVLTK